MIKHKNIFKKVARCFYFSLFGGSYSRNVHKNIGDYDYEDNDEFQESDAHRHDGIG